MMERWKLLFRVWSSHIGLYGSGVQGFRALGLKFWAWDAQSLVMRAYIQQERSGAVGDVEKVTDMTKGAFTLWWFCWVSQDDTM